MKFHKMTSMEAEKEREKIKHFALEKQLMKHQVKIRLDKLTPSEIRQWTPSDSSQGSSENEWEEEKDSSNFKTTLQSLLSKSLTIPLIKLSPSKLLQKKIESPETPEVPLEADDDPEIVINSKKRSRSSSPISNSSSREENIDSPQRKRKQPNPERRVLSTKTDLNRTPIRPANAAGPSRKTVTQQLVMEAKSYGISMSRRTIGSRARNRIGPKSKMNKS